MLALPEVERERKKLPRSYLANVLYTLVGQKLQLWVEKRVNDRNTKVQKERDMIERDPRIAQIYPCS